MIEGGRRRDVFSGAGRNRARTINSVNGIMSYARGIISAVRAYVVASLSSDPPGGVGVGWWVGWGGSGICDSELR